MEDILFYPFLSFYKKPVGAIKTNENCTIVVKIIKSYEIYNLLLHIFNDNYEEVLVKPLFIEESDYYHDDNYNTYIVNFSLDKTYLYWYHFTFNDCFGRHFIGRSADLGAKLYDNNPWNYQLNCYKENCSDFSWYQGKVMYQIYPDRFMVGEPRNYKKDGYNYKNELEEIRYLPYNGVYCNDFYGGNFRGIIQKLDYLKELGVGVIYLNPISLSPTNHHYDTSDYLKIDDVLGTEDDFVELIEKAKKVGINIIIDGVYNHTGSDSIYFNKDQHFSSVGAFNSPKSPYYSWYNFISYPSKYETWWGIETLPRVNQASSFVDFITGDDGVISHYMDMGIKGIRLDVVDELNDEFVRKINKSIKTKDENAITIGEVWEDASSKMSYGLRKQYFDGTELDSVMNYPLRLAIIDFLSHNRLEKLVYFMREEINNFPKFVLNSMMNLLSSHDMPRINSTFSGVNFNNLSKREASEIVMTKTEYYKCRNLVEMAYIMTYTLPGIPSLYYGDEIGMEGGKDPFCRQMMKWNPEEQDKELLSFFKKLGKMREELFPTKVLVDGLYQEEYFENNIYIYNRHNDQVKLIVIINNSDYDYYYPVAYATNLLSGFPVNGGTIIYPKTGAILLIR